MKWNWHKRILKDKNQWNIGILGLVTVILLCSVFVVRSGEKQQPANPLILPVEAAVKQTFEEEKTTGTGQPEESAKPWESQQPQQSMEPVESQMPEEKEPTQEDPQPDRTQSPSEQQEKEEVISGNENPGGFTGELGGTGDQIIPGSVTNQNYFTTSIKDGQVVEKTHYSFRIKHLVPELKVDKELIYVNQQLWPQFQGFVLLEKGENHIRIAVRYQNEENKTFMVYRDYTIYVQTKEGPTSEPSIVPQESATPSEEISIVTNLTETTLHQEDFSFDATFVGGTKHAKMQVYQNGVPVNGNGHYDVKLNIGNNTFQLKVYDTIDGNNITKEKTVHVTYVPVATENTAPKITYINVTDGMETIGDKFVLDLQAQDYMGNVIYAEGMQIVLNGVRYKYKWANESISYDLKLQNGDNTLQIRITDGDGRYTDYQYTMKCTAVADGEPIGTAVISMDADVLGLGTLLEPVEVTIYQGEELAYVICRVLEEYGFECMYTGSLDGSADSFYLVRVSMEGMAVAVEIPAELQDAINAEELEWKEQRYDDSIGQFDYCQGSGWLYSVNGHFPNYSASECYLKDGDNVRIRFTLAYGKDVGGHAGGESYDIPWLK